MPNNVVLLFYDCLRLDYWRKRMPRAKAATRGWFDFRNHWAVAHCSDPNFSTILGGQPPWITGITTQMGMEYKAVSPALLPLVLKAAGYYTAAIQPVKVPKFYHGFDDIAWQPMASVADLELGAVKAMTKAAGDTPFFLFVRDMTCHYPYNNQPMPARGEGGEIRPQYDEAVKHVDEHVARVINYIKTHHPNTIILIGSDHGELLGEHGEYDHLYTLYNYLIRPPMVAYVPGLKGKIANEPTQHTDIWPTVLDLCGHPSDSQHGVSLAGWMRGDTKLKRNRRLWFSGIGAGPVLESDKRPRLDSGARRMLWRHRGVVQNGVKIVENIHADGQRGRVVTKAGDYAERKPYSARSDKATLPPIPDYHEWELDIIQTHQEVRDQLIMERLEALGYA
jgi:arylsulfatase A-like enzyme